MLKGYQNFQVRSEFRASSTAAQGQVGVPDPEKKTERRIHDKQIVSGSMCFRSQQLWKMLVCPLEDWLYAGLYNDSPSDRFLEKYRGMPHSL